MTLIRIVYAINIVASTAILMRTAENRAWRQKDHPRLMDNAIRSAPPASTSDGDFTLAPFTFVSRQTCRLGPTLDQKMRISRNMASVIASVLALGLLAGVARAEVNVDPRAGEGDAKAFARCISDFERRGHDPADAYREAEVDSAKVNVIPTPGQGPSSTGGGATDAPTIKWRDRRTDPYPDGTPFDRCAALYHELAHVADDRHNGVRRAECFYRNKAGRLVGSGITIDEVVATRADNAYRKATGKPQRRRYGKHALPPDNRPCYDSAHPSARGDPYPRQISLTFQLSRDKVSPTTGVVSVNAVKIEPCTMTGVCEYKPVRADGKLIYKDKFGCSGSDSAPPWNTGLPFVKIVFSPTGRKASHLVVVLRGDHDMQVKCKNGPGTVGASISGGGPQPGPLWRPGQTQVLMPIADPGTGTITVQLPTAASRAGPPRHPRRV